MSGRSPIRSASAPAIGATRATSPSTAAAAARRRAGRDRARPAGTARGRTPARTATRRAGRSRRCPPRTHGAEESHREHRRARPLLPRHEGRDQRRRRRRSERPPPGSAQPTRLPRTSPHTTPSAPAVTSARPRDVERDVAPPTLSGRRQRASGTRASPIGTLSQKIHVPRQPVGDRAADHRATDHRQAGDPEEDAERAPRRSGGKARADEREGGGHDERRADALDAPAPRSAGRCSAASAQAGRADDEHHARRLRRAGADRSGRRAPPPA